MNLNQKNVQEKLEMDIAKLAKGTNRATEETPRQREYNIPLDEGEFAPAENNRYVSTETCIQSRYMK